jgi:hypothetical protein
MPSGAFSLVGRKFGALRVIRERRCDVYVCQCDCGKKLTVFRSQLTKGSIRCCIDCAPKGARWSSYYGHIRYYIGKSGRRRQKTSSELLSFLAARNRTNYKTTSCYEDYGGRGIRMCPEWLEPNGVGFKRFLKHIGPRPIGCTLDRINPNGHYEPGNVRWSNIDVQNSNQRRFLWPSGQGEPPVVPMNDLEDELLACG